jgi:hypothetical protein
MDKKNQIALVAGLVVGSGLLAYLILSGNIGAGSPTAGGLGVFGGSDTAGSEASPPADEPVLDQTTLGFERSVSLDETLELPVLFRDYAQLPADFSDYEAAVRSLPPIPGQVTFTFKSYKEVDRLGPMLPEPGNRFVYVTYELVGDSANPSGERVVPNNPFSAEPDLAPQAVLALGDETIKVDSREFNLLMNTVGLDHPTHLDFDEPKRRLYGAVWQRPINRLPLVALEYQHADGSQRLIKLDY